MSVPFLFEVRAPGSVYLWGEHAVLQGYPAVIAAVDPGIRVRLYRQADTPTFCWRSYTRDRADQWQCTHDWTGAPIQWMAGPPADRFWRIAWEVWREMATSCQDIASDPIAPDFWSGVVVEVYTEAPPASGYGTSGAVVAALVQAWYQEVRGALATPEVVLAHGIRVVHAVQSGWGSGGDIAASLWGGVIGYQVDPRTAKSEIWAQLAAESAPGQWWSRFVGYKRATADVMAVRAPVWARTPGWHRDLWALMGQLGRHAVQAWEVGDLDALGAYANQGHGLLEALGVCDQSLSELVYAYRGCPEITGAKISGSGLGDGVIAVGYPPTFPLAPGSDPIRGRPLVFARRGVQLTMPFPTDVHNTH